MKDCNSIKKQLSVYIDNELTPDERLKIKEHLGICQDCAEELDELKKSIEHLQNLDKVEPPPWLTKKVIASIKTEWANIETPPKKSLFEKIFYPFYIKVPVGAAAAVFIAVITIYIFKVIEPAMEYKALQEPPKEISEEVAPLLPSEQKAKEYVLGSRLEKDDQKSVTNEAPKKELPGVPVMKDYEKSKTYPSALAGAVSAKEIPETKSLKSPIQELKVEKNVPEQKQYAGALDKKMVSQGIAAQEHYFYITTGDQNAENKIVEAIKQLDGNIIHQVNSGNRIFISAEIQASKLKELADKFKAVGTVGEKSIFSVSDKDRISIRIEILKIPN
jgi:hypothetical protein